MLPGILAKQTGPGLSSSLLAKAYGRITDSDALPRILLTSVILLHGRFSFCTSSAFSIGSIMASRRGTAFSFHLGKACTTRPV
jgi:hypothetical protein